MVGQRVHGTFNKTQTLNCALPVDVMVDYSVCRNDPPVIPAVIPASPSGRDLPVFLSDPLGVVAIFGSTHEWAPI
jgi:hypothetical protein